MAERTVAAKLRLKAGETLGVVGADEADLRLLHPVPDGAKIEIGSVSGAEVAVVFVRSQAELVEQLGAQLPVTDAARAVWFCYPKAGRADVNRDGIMREVARFGWRPISNVAVDDVWSAVRVRPLHPGEAPIG